MKKMKIVLSGATIGVFLVGIVGMASLQKDLDVEHEMIFFTLQGDNTVSSFPIVHN